MKKINFKWLLLSFILSMASFNDAWGTYYFLKAGVWATDNVKMGMRYWGGASEGVKIMTKIGSSDVYYVDDSDVDYTGFQIVRYKTNGTDIDKYGNDWSSGNNFYTVTGWDTHSWSNAGTFTVAGDEAFAGSNWDATDTDNDMTFSSTNAKYNWTKSSVALTEGSTYQCKVVKNHDWNNNSWPESNLDLSNVDITGTGYYNILITYDISDNSVTATATPITYQVSFDKNGGTGSAMSNQNFTYGTAQNLTSNSYNKTGHDFAGWATSSDGSVLYSDGESVSNLATTQDDVYPLYAKWAPSVYGITYYDKGGSAYSGSNSASLPSSYTYGTGVTLVNGVKAGYTFEGWYTASDCSSGKTTSIGTAVTGNKIFYANWEALAEGSVTLSAGTGGQVSKDNTNWSSSATITGITSDQAVDIYARPNAGYTFNTWTKTAGTGSIKTNAASGAYNAKGYSAEAVTASFTETKVTLIPSVDYNGGATPATPYTVTSSNTVGVTTSTTLTASAPTETEYTFAGWTLTNLTVTSGNAATDRSISVKITTPGSAISAVANYNEVLTTGWYLAGEFSNEGNTDAGWGASKIEFMKPSGASTGNVAYATLDLDPATFASDGYDMSFKITDGGANWLGNSGTYDKSQNNQQWRFKGEEGDCTLDVSVEGTYTFRLQMDTTMDTFDHQKAIRITYPNVNKLNISAADPTDATNTGNFDLSDPVSNVRSVKRSLNANTTYTFKIVYNSDWYGYTSDSFTRSTSTSSNSLTTSTSGGNMTLTTDYAGDYTFRFNQSTKDLSVDFPTAYKVTYGKGTVDGSSGSCSAKDIDNGNAAVTSNSTWVKSGNRVVLTAPAAKTGYTYNGWFDNNSGTGDAITTNANCTITVSSAATLYACYTINNHAITHSDASHGSYTIKVDDASAVSTNTTSDYGKTITLAATPATGYHFGSWSAYKTETPATTVTVTSNQFIMPDYAVTVGATFTPNTYRVHFHRNGGAGETVYQNFTYDVAQNLTANSYTRTGYTFAGWATSTSGEVEHANGANVSNLTSENGVDYHLYAKWTPNPYAITFIANGGALVGSSPKNVIFDETSVAECPTATKDGYCFDGWYTKASSGQKVINADGTLVASVTDESQYTGAGGAWKKASATTVYAVYVAPTIEMTPDPTALNSRKTEKDTVVIHQTFSCEPTGNYNVVYTVGYSANHTQLPSQPTIKYGTGVGTGYDTIKMPMDANTYEIVAELRTGSTRGAGTIVIRDTIDYVVEAQYAVTLHYVVDGKNIRESRQVYAYPTSAPSEVRVFMEESGYELDYWEMGVGIDSVPGRGSRTDEGVLGIMEHKYIYAANNGNIYLHYKPKTNTVYFFNTFDKYWFSTIMKKYDYGTTDGYWQSTYGADSHGGLTNDTVKSTTTSLEEKKWMASIGGSTTHFAFTNKKMDNYDHFYGNATGNEWARVIYRTDYNSATPMFVPVAIDDDDYYVMNQDENGAARYYRGFWVKYSPNSDSTGYYLKVYNGTEYGSSLVESIPLRLTQTGEGNTWELTASMDLEANKTYGFKFTKATGTSSVDWYRSSGTMTASDHEGWVFTSGAGNNCGLTTTSAGDYTFHVFCKDFGTKEVNAATASDVQGQLAVTVDYATVSGDYRVIYSDATQTEVIASPSIHSLANGQDTVSFFIRADATSRVMKIQKYDSDWEDVSMIDLSAAPFSIAKDSVYVIYLQQNEDGTSISATGYDFYDGDYYIRTDCVDEHKWDYKQSLDNHRMSPSDYGMADIQPDKFTHYYVHWIGKGGNVKFIVANKYAPCLSDTVITDTYANVSGGNLPSSHGANVRFMYNKGTNVALRAYLYGSEEGDDDYLKITTSTSQMGTTAETPAIIPTMTFTDEKNWVYQAEIKAKPGLTAKLTAEYNSNIQYFMGSADKEESIIGGTGDAWQQILLTYDFKVNRLICAWQPSGDSINGDVPINADVMIIRHGQDEAQQIIFKNNDSKLSAVKYIYSVMQFNRDDMVGMMPRWDYWSYQHCMYYISFPYDVLVNDIMAPGRMGTEWRIQRYNGAKRAKGWFAGDGVTTFWEDVQAGDTLKAYEGYSLLLNRRIFNDGSSTVWQNKGAGSKLYMYFPSKDATTGVVANKTVNVTVPSHECTLDRVFDQDLGKPASEQRNHKIVDSHWNMIGTPLFEDKVASTITDGPTMEASTGSDKLQYIYEWNPAGNTLGIRNTLTTGFEFKTMYSYMAQYAGTITFVGSAVNKIVAANRSADKKNYTINLELTKDDAFVGRTYVELRENAVDTFLLNEDVCMVKNGVSADVYTLAGAYEAGANVLSIDNHIVPVGVDVKAAGTYTFSMPGNFDGEIILVDNYMQTRTNLMMEDYEIALPKANISDRFYLEININNTPTAIDGVSGDGSFKDGKAHKFIMNDMMYILKDGLLFDARGNRVK